MQTALTKRIFGGATTDVVNFGSAADVDDLPASTCHACALVYRTANADNLIIASKRSSASNGFQFLLAERAGPTWGFLRLVVWRASVVADVFASTNAMALNTLYVVGFSWNPSGTPRLFWGTATGTVAEVTTYSSQTVGSGAYSSDAAGDLLVGNQYSGTLPFKGEIERFGIGTGEITAAQVQRWRDTALAQGDLLLAYLGSGSPEPDYSGHSRTGTVTGTTAGTARDPVYIIQSGDLWDTFTPELKNQYLAGEYLYRASYAPVKVTCAADLVDVTAWVTYYDNTLNRAGMTSTPVFVDGQYAGQKKFTTIDAYNRGTIAITPGSTIEILTGARSRRTAANDGTEPQQGTFPTTLRFSAGGSPVSATLVTPTTPANTEIIVSDSVVGDGFSSDPCGQHTWGLQRRRAKAGAPRVAFASYGGYSWYIAAKDSTAITALTTRLAQYAGTNKQIILELGANDYVSALWTPSAMATQVSAALTAILAVAGVNRVTMFVPVLCLQESTAVGGYLLEDFRTALLTLPPFAQVTFINSKTFLSATNFVAGDNFHPTNAGQDELFANFTTALIVAGAPAPGVTQVGPRVSPRSRFLLDWDAAVTLERPDQVLHARTGQLATFSRAATATALDTAGATQTFAEGQPAYEWNDLDGDGIKEALTLLGVNDRLFLDYGGLPSARTFYIDMLEKTATGASNGSRIIEIGDSSAATGYLAIRRAAGGYDAIHHNGTSSVTATVSVTAAAGDRIQLRLIVASNGALTLAVTKNSGTETVGSATSSLTLAAAWNQARLAIGSDYAGANRASQAFRHVREYPGSQSRAFMAAG